MIEWREEKLSNLGEIITGKTPSLNNPEDWGEDIPFITPSDFSNYNKYALTAIRNLSSIGANRLIKKIIPPFSVLVTCIGSDMGKVVMNRKQVITNQQINSLIPNNSVDNDFLYYSLVDLYEILRIYGGDGTAVPIINKTDFGNLKIFLPPLPEQKAISGVLSSLDDKIDLLHRQNKTLESMAETLFRQWFSEEAEDDWEEGKLGDMVNFLSGYSFKSNSFLPYGTYKIVTIKAVQDGYLELKNASQINIPPNNMPEYCYLNIGDILLSLTGNVGRCCLIDHRHLLLNQRVAKLQPTNSIYYPYIYFFFRQKSTRLMLEELAKGTAQLNLSPVETSNMIIDFPPLQLLSDFHEIANPILKKIIFNKQSIKHTETLRNTLLPKLMSGEVRVEF